MSRTHELVEAFTEAVPAALYEMAGVEAVVCPTPSAGANDVRADVVAAIDLAMASGSGRVELCLPQPTAVELASRVLAGAVDRVTADLVRDCLGEVVNVVAGHAKALLVGRPSHFMLSTPVVKENGPVGRSPSSLIRFKSNVGAFDVLVSAPA